MAKSMGKSTNAEIELRVQVVTAMILQGYSRADIVRHGSKKWSISSRQIDDYLKASKQVIKDSVKGSTDDQILLAKARYNDLYQKNYKGRDFKECRAVQDSYNKLAGLYEKDNEQSRPTAQVTIFQLPDNGRDG